MADTIRTTAALQTLLRDGQGIGTITPQIVRDMLVSTAYYPATAAELALGVTPIEVYPYGDVRRFGAVGNGVTDDTTAFQNAIAAGLPVEVPLTSAGYLVSATLNLDNLTRINSAGGATIKFTGSAAGFSSVGASNWSIKGLKIDTTGTSSAYAIQADAASSDYTLDGISVLANSVTGTPKGILSLSGSNAIVRNSTFDGCYYVLFTGVTGGGCTDNTFYNIAAGVYLDSVAGTFASKFVVANNRFLSANASVALINGLDAILVADSKDVAISGNVIAAATEHGIYVSDGTDGSSRISVTGNTVSGWGSTAGIQIRGNSSGTGSYNENISLAGNVVTGAGALAAGNLVGFIIQGCRNVSGSANQATGCVTGFYFDNVVGGTFIANTADKNGSAVFWLNDTNNIGASSNLLFLGNQSLNGNLNALGFVGFHIGYTHAWAHSNFRFIGNNAANTWRVTTASTAVRASNVVTVTTSATHGYSSGTYARLVVAGMGDGTFNGTLSNVVMTVIDATHFSYPQVAADATSSAGTFTPKSLVSGFTSTLSGGATLDTVEFTSNSGNTLVTTLFGAIAGTNISRIDASAGNYAISTPNAAQWVYGQASELLTLSTSGTTTDTTANLLPANSIIESVVARVTTAITTATSWALGDATTAARFAAANATMTLGATSIGTVQADQTGAAGPRQAAAAKVRVTTVGTPGAGAVRITVFYRQFVAPTS